MGSKNVCALEFACILGHNIKWSVIIIIIIIQAAGLANKKPRSTNFISLRFNHIMTYC